MLSPFFFREERMDNPISAQAMCILMPIVDNGATAPWQVFSFAGLARLIWNGGLSIGHLERINKLMAYPCTETKWKEPA